MGRSDTSAGHHHSDLSKQVCSRRNLIPLAIAVTAIFMFTATASTVLPRIFQAMAGQGIGPDRVVTNALLLNIALVIFGWRRYASMSAEVGERRKAEQSARDQADHDPLTGCLNRRSIGAATDALIEQARLRGQALAFIMFDLDKFKHINDLNGHAAGDLMERKQIAVQPKVGFPIKRQPVRPEVEVKEEVVSRPLPPPTVLLAPKLGATPKAVEMAKAPADVPVAQPDFPVEEEIVLPPPEPVIPVQVARYALGFVGADPQAEEVWFEAINDPNMPAKARQDLIEDLNEEGFADPRNITRADLPLILSRIALIEQVGPDAMDEVNARAFAEAYKDLVNMAIRLGQQ